MSLFVIGDPHLSFGCQKPMDIFKGWENHAVRLEDYTYIYCGRERYSGVAGRYFLGDEFRRTAARFSVSTQVAGKESDFKGESRLLVVDPE